MGFRDCEAGWGEREGRHGSVESDERGWDEFEEGAGPGFVEQAFLLEQGKRAFERRRRRLCRAWHYSRYATTSITQNAFAFEEIANTAVTRRRCARPSPQLADSQTRASNPDTTGSLTKTARHSRHAWLAQRRFLAAEYCERYVALHERPLAARRARVASTDGRPCRF